MTQPQLKTQPGKLEKSAKSDKLNRILWASIGVCAVVSVGALVSFAIIQSSPKPQPTVLQTPKPSDCNGATKEATTEWCKNEAIRQLRIASSASVKFNVEHYQCKTVDVTETKRTYSGDEFGVIEFQGHDGQLKKDFWCNYDGESRNGTMSFKTVQPKLECGGAGESDTKSWCKEQALNELKQPLKNLHFYSDKYSCERLTLRNGSINHWGLWKGFIKVTDSHRIQWKSFYCSYLFRLGSSMKIFNETKETANH